MNDSMFAKVLSAFLWTRLSSRFRLEEIESSVVQIASRWVFVLSESERKAIARQLGGNRYSKTAYHTLDSIMRGILEDSQDEVS